MFRRKRNEHFDSSESVSSVSSKRGAMRKHLKHAGMVVGSVALIGCVWGAIELGAPAPNPAQERLDDLLKRSTAHQFVIPAYEQCMAVKGAIQYRCVKSTAEASKAQSITTFQLIGVFKDYGLDVNGSDFPPI